MVWLLFDAMQGSSPEGIITFLVPNPSLSPWKNALYRVSNLVSRKMLPALIPFRQLVGPKEPTPHTRQLYPVSAGQGRWMRPFLPLVGLSDNERATKQDFFRIPIAGYEHFPSSVFAFLTCQEAVYL